MITVSRAGDAFANAARPTRTSDSGVFGTDNLTNIATPSFTGTAELGNMVTLFDGGVAVGSAVAGVDKSWTAVANLRSDCVHGIAAQAVDVAGNVSAMSSALAVALDTQTPAAPQFAIGSLTQVTGPGEAGSSIVLMDGSTAIGGATVGTTGNWSISFLPAPRNAY